MNQRICDAYDDGAQQVEASLGQFLANMALDPARLIDFLENPDASLKQSNLSEESRLALQSGDPSTIATCLSVERGGPVSAPWNCPALVAI